jgi:phage gpG-like protein
MVRPPVKGLRVDFGLKFEFRPGIGIMARDVDKLALDIRSFRVPLERSIKQVLIPSFRKNFEVGGRPGWVPLAEATIERRQDEGYNAGPTLVRSGLLKRTMGQFNIWTVDREKAALMDLPAKVWYGKIQQGGYGMKGSARSGSKAAGIPARPFAMVQSPKDFDDIEKVFETWLAERIEQRWQNTRRAVSRGRF